MTDNLTSDRTVLRVSGTDADRFLQDLVTNDLSQANHGLVYTALLSPQGKYLFDFFVFKDADGYLIDIKTSRAQALAQRLTMYRLRAKVDISATDLKVCRGISETPSDGLNDPRHSALGWRAFRADGGISENIDWDAIRVANCIPETDIELVADSSYILECGFERLHGVDFKKGCYVGQEVTARMKHKTELRKGLTTVQVSGPTEIGDKITKDGKDVGTVHTRSADHAIAYLRFDRANGTMQAGTAVVTRMDEP